MTNANGVATVPSQSPTRSQPKAESHTHPSREEMKIADSLYGELTARIDGEVRFDKGSRALYATDGSNYRQVPIGVVIPRTIKDAETTINLCHKYGAPIVSRGCGTSLAGQCCNVAVVIDYSKYVNNILDIWPDRKLARVQPGVILDHLRNKTEEHHLTFGPDPATHNHCTFGGMIGNNSCGIHSVMAGRTSDNVHELEIMTYDGLRMRVGATSDRELDAIIREGGRRGEIYEQLRALRDKYADLIRSRYPDIPRRVSGYNLDDLLPENGFHVARALAGSESTLVNILDATVCLVHSPPARALLVVGYPSVYEAGDHVTEIMKFNPVGLEGIDHKLLGYMRIKHMHLRDLNLLPDGKGWLLVEFGGDTKDEARQKARDAADALGKQKNAPTTKVYTDDTEEEHVWEIRESGLGATANIPNHPLTWPGWEDSAVAPERVGDYLRSLQKLYDKYNYDAALYGHFGQGCIHTRIPFDLETRDGIAKSMRFIEEASSLVVDYGGSCSGEHGDGQARAATIEKMYGPELMQAFREFKRIWDPDGGMNPGKVIEAYLPDQNLRLGPEFHPQREQTYYKFLEDGGSMPRATLRCVGVGLCRRTEDAFMCPSFLATREENDTTRGRAHLLFEMFRGDQLDEGWKSQPVFDSLDLCLGCKGCKSECPVDVDMAKYKSEFLAHYYQYKNRPRKDYAMGLIGRWASLGQIAPGIANGVLKIPGVETLARAVTGMTQHRPVPRLASESYTHWFKRVDHPDRKGPRVLLYPDLFNDAFYADTLKSACRVLERWGYRVEIPERRPPCVRPLLHYGFLDEGVKKLNEALDLIGPFVREGVPIVFCEPSTMSVFTDEAPDLVPNNEDMRRVAPISKMFGQFALEAGVELPHFGGKAVFHAHCHQKAVLDTESSRELLRKMGIDFEEPQKTCCGMAGSFGFEAEHYDISMKIANLGLVPAVEQAADGTHLIADGFSCRTQIFDATGRTALHVAQLIDQAFAKGGAPHSQSGNGHS